MPSEDENVQLTSQTDDATPSSDNTSLDQSAGTQTDSNTDLSATPDTSTTHTSAEEPTDLWSAVRWFLKSPADRPPAAGSSAGTPDAQSGTGDGGATGTAEPGSQQTGATQPKELTEADFADVDKPSV